MIGELHSLVKGDFVDMIDLDALHGPASVPVQPREWFILRTHPNCERKVMREFDRRHISGYCPMIWREQRVARLTTWGAQRLTMRRVLQPLFPGLVFVPDFDADHVPVHAIREVSGWLRFGDWFARIPSERDRERVGDDLAVGMSDIRALVAIANTPHSKREAKFAKGDLVRIVDGPFRDFAGRIERLDSKGRLTVAIDIFGRLSSTTMSEWQIEPSQGPTDTCTGHERRKPRRGSFSCR
jgi:transcriptional antiterminator NusG